MKLQSFIIDHQKIDYYFDGVFSHLHQLADTKRTVLITDENVFEAHTSKFSHWKTIVIKSGERYKNFETVQFIVAKLAEYEADRTFSLIGVGGGVVTDITGLVASIYMRGISFGFVPTSLLNTVDASLGGKNGIDFGMFKNLVGSIVQPKFILQDLSFLETLPKTEWENGFAEIIKHACIKDKSMFDLLQAHKLEDFMNDKNLLFDILSRNVLIKLKVVQNDPYEQGERKLLNFGHTIGHAIENTLEIPHGKAVAIGMFFAAKISAKETNFEGVEQLKTVLANYNLPIAIKFNSEAIFEILKLDKKRHDQQISFILLEETGKGSIKDISLPLLKVHLTALKQEY